MLLLHPLLLLQRGLLRLDNFAADLLALGAGKVSATSTSKQLWSFVHLGCGGFGLFALSLRHFEQ